MAKTLLANEIGGFFDEKYQLNKLVIYQELWVAGKYSK